MQDDKQAVNKTNQSQVVTAVGNSWVICKSKSYQGRTYYFNTLTGKAAWNLSDAEIERAKKRSLDDQSVEALNDCPEPKEPPMDNLDKRSPQYIYNKKVINNRFANESYPRTTYVAPHCNYFVPHNSGTQRGLTHPTQSYNPEPWNIPPTHHIFITPAVSPMVNQSQMPVNEQYSDPQHVSMENTSASRHFQNHNPNFNNIRHAAHKYFKRGSGKNKYTPRSKRFGHGNFQRNFQDKPNDLREILSIKRKQRLSQDTRDDFRDDTDANYLHNISNNYEERLPVPCTSLDENKTHIPKEIKEDHYISDTESSWLEDNVKVQGTKLNLDITCLRNLAASDADPDSWYIAVDRTILLNHLNFLNMLINSDDECQLLVPREELEALRELASSADVATRTPRVSNRARRALNFVLQQFDMLCAVQGEELETESTSSHILNCCLNVAEYNYHVILLSNNTDLLAQKEYTSIIMFNMNELKALLAKSKDQVKPCPETPIPLENAIKKTISNDFVRKTGSNKSNITLQSIQANTEEQYQQDNSKTPENNIDVGTKENALPPNIETMDTGVQTDFATPTAGEVKRREIRLKRSTSNVTTNNKPCADQNTGNKQFRWRRKRKLNTSITATNDASNQTNCLTITHTSNDLEKTRDIETGQQVNQVSAENIEVSDTSSSVCIQRSVYEKTVEESSTSGIISNTTASNHDADSVTNESTIKFKTRFNYNTDEQEESLKSNYMFRITCQPVEECLRMRSDEWISRFVQIMEEVLTQVLQQKKTTYFHLTPPPWTLQEALLCILRSSDYDGDVIDAAKQLSNTLYNISDEKGKINTELRPIHFMEMYSYGVYLVDALQGTAYNSEDLQTASDSLAKLLKDIQEPNLDSSHNETFGEQNQDISIDGLQDTDVQHDSLNVKDTVKENLNAHYNLRTKQSKSSDQLKVPVAVEQVKFIRKIDVEANFFTSLNLQKRITDQIGETTETRDSTSQELGIEKPSDLKLQTNATRKLIRQKYMEFEEQHRESQREPVDLDQLDYSANFDDNYECVEDNYYNEVEDYLGDKELAVDQYELNHEQEQNEFHEKEHSPTQSPDINGNTAVRAIIKTCINETRDTLMQVQEFCNNTDEHLRQTRQSSGRRKYINEKAVKAYNCIEDIIKVLNSIVYRETYQPENSMQSALKTAGIDGFELNNELYTNYRDTIVKWLYQASILLEAVGVIISATKTK